MPVNIFLACVVAIKNRINFLVHTIDRLLHSFAVITSPVKGINHAIDTLLRRLAAKALYVKAINDTSDVFDHLIIEVRLPIAAINLHEVGVARCMVEAKRTIHIFVHRVVCKAAAHNKPIS